MLSLLRVLVLLSSGFVYITLLYWSSTAFVDTRGSFYKHHLFVRRCISAARLSSSLSRIFGLITKVANRLSRSRITIRLMPGETKPATSTRASQSVFSSTLHAYFPSLAVPAKARNTSPPMAGNPSSAVAMARERELSIRLDVILSALIAGSFAWMCCTRFRRYPNQP